MRNTDASQRPLTDGTYKWLLPLVRLMCTMTSWQNYFWSFVREIRRWPEKSHHKGPIMKIIGVFSNVSLCELCNKWSNFQWPKPPWRSCNVVVMTCGNENQRFPNANRGSHKGALVIKDKQRWGGWYTSIYFLTIRRDKLDTYILLYLAGERYLTMPGVIYTMH